MVDFGYDVADYRGVDPLFGTLDDLDGLLARAHALGLKVIVDQVYSHTSDQHPWFCESRRDRDNPRHDWYIWAAPKPDGAPPNNWLSLFGGSAWQWDPRRRQYYLHNFAPEQPDLNFGNPEVRRALLEVARFWLSRGVAGLRLDVANFYFCDPELRDNPPAELPPGATPPQNPYAMQRHLYNTSQPQTLGFLEELRAELDRAAAADGAERMAVAEIYCDRQLETMVAYTEGERRLHTAYSFSFLDAPRLDAALVRETIEGFFSAADAAWPSWSFSNHDRIRAPSRWFAELAEGSGERGAEQEEQRAKLALALLCALPGTIFVYQGEELGLPEGEVPREAIVDPVGKAFWPDDKGRDGCRTPMPWEAGSPSAGFSPAGATRQPWLPVDPRQRERAVDRQERRSGSVLGCARALFRFRRERAALRGGAFRFVEAPEPLLRMIRGASPERLEAVFNLGAEPLEVEVEGTALIGPQGGGTLRGGRLSLRPWGFAYLDRRGV